MTDTQSSKFAAKRARLAELLTEAAEIEHDVLCQYLFAAFSMKKAVREGVKPLQFEKIRAWQGTLFAIARQEMEHLGIVCNLLTAIGEAPFIWRANYPLSSRHYPVRFKSTLEAFSLKSLDRFIGIEMPQASAETARLLSQNGIDATGMDDFGSIGALYNEIEGLFEELDALKTLFIGPKSAQMGLLNILPFGAFLRGVSVAPNARMYDVELMPVCDLASAKSSIHQIVVEGEGGDQNVVPESHFVRFLAMRKELSEELTVDPLFAPARPVVRNPKTGPDPTRECGGTIITDTATRGVSELFDAAYGTMLLLLVRFLANTDESPAEIAALDAIIFFPLMTTIIRPVAELLTQLPAHPGSRETAGPSFDIARRIQFLPHREAAWQVMLQNLEHIAALARSLAADKSYEDPVRTRLQLVFENARRIVINFTNGMNLK
jgi:hypothetical protein